MHLCLAIMLGWTFVLLWEKVISSKQDDFLVHDTVAFHNYPFRDGK
jgi:hypothetical protein